MAATQIIAELGLSKTWFYANTHNTLSDEHNTSVRKEAAKKASLFRHKHAAFDNKVCASCKKDLPRDDFYVRGSFLHAYCKVCMKKYAAIQRKIYRNKIKDMISTGKKKPCMDCNKEYDPFVMDYVHIPGEEKKFCLSRAGSDGKGTQIVIDEIAKCDLVCACCHRLRTKARARELRTPV